MRRILLGFLAATILTTFYLPARASSAHHRHHHPWQVCRRRNMQTQPAAVDRMISCWAPRIGQPVRGTLCIGDRESTDHAYDDNGSGDRGIFQESAWSMVWQFFKTGVSPYSHRRIAPPHRGMWVLAHSPSGAVRVWNARAQVLAEPWWMRFFGAGRWSTAGRCGM